MPHLETNSLSGLTKSELSLLLTEQLDLNKNEAKELIDGFFELVVTELTKGRRVKIAGFGSFAVRNKVARIGHNPKTGESMTMPARAEIFFKPNNLLKEKIKKAN